jgi:CheY-like chemotaxis protein
MNSRPARILVVDDERDICENLRDILGDLGHDVSMAHDGPSALDLTAKSPPFDVALIDLKMPGMDGLTLYAELKRRWPSLVAMLVTAHSGMDTPERAARAGAWRVLPKPVDLPRLHALLEEAIGQPLVLVVDDDHDLCENLWDLLRERGFRVGWAHSEAEATDQLADGRFQVVLIDLKMPESDPAHVLDLARASEPAARTMLITAYRPEMDGLITTMLERGADAVCYKPFQVPELLGTLERLVGREGDGRHS